ncbi:MAG: 3,4-dihydroxyphenylacetate 2,3-dioxygenase [Solirubrobacteraceae bacterium]
MSGAAELVAAPRVRTPFDIVRAARVELQVTDLKASERFYVDLLGLVVSARTESALYLRGWEERQHHSIVLRRGPIAGVAALGFRVAAAEDLEILTRELAARGMVVAEEHVDAPGMGRTLAARDPFGYPLQFFYEMDQFETQAQRFDLHRGAPILRLDHLNLHEPRVEQAVAFWQSLGLTLTEYISTDGPEERITGAWLRRKPAVHDVALTMGRGPRLHHVGMWVGDPMGVLRACDQIAAAGYVDCIERGPGRHGVSNAFFVYLRDPDGHRIELYACDYYTGDPDHRPLRWSVNDARCRSFWGTRAPDRWYEESSSLLTEDGGLVPTHEADVDERTQRSPVMA